MKVTNETIWDAREAIGPVGQLPAGALTPKTKYWMGRLEDVLATHLKRLEKERVALIEQFGTMTERGQEVPPNTPGFKLFNTAWREIMEEEPDVGWTQIIRPGSDTKPFTSHELRLLRPFIDFLEPEEETAATPQREGTGTAARGEVA